MGRRKRVTPTVPPPTAPSNLRWLRVALEFPTTFSYRQAEASSQFAVGSPVPSPAAIKLTLVDTAIRWKGSVEEGKQVFEWVKTCPVYPVPPERVIRFRSFIKRLKPSKEQGKTFEESTGIRDYFLLNGPLQIFLQVPSEQVEAACQLFQRVRKLGTSDSLCWCCEVKEVPDAELEEWRPYFPRKVSELDENFLASMIIQGLIVVRLSDLTEQSEFDGFNPFGGESHRAHRQPNSYLLPLALERYGETWVLLRRTPLLIENPNPLPLR